MDDIPDEQFVVDEVTSVINETVDNVLSGNSYSHFMLPKWTSMVSEACLSALHKMQKPFKYVVITTIMQRNGAGLQSASACYWDKATDASATVRWQNSTIYAVVTVFGVAV